MTAGVLAPYEQPDVIVICGDPSQYILRTVGGTVISHDDLERKVGLLGKDAV
jgi:hypothetical protein